MYNVQQKFKLPWCVSGDFNAVSFPNERSNGQRSAHFMQNFNDWVEICSLLEIHISNKLLTGSFFVAEFPEKDCD